MFIAPGAPAPKTGKVYDIKGTKWIQEPMEYFTFTKALDLLRGRFDGFFAGQQTAGDLLDSLVHGPEIGQVIRLIMRPHNPTPIAWIQNHTKMKLTGVDPNDPLSSMRLQQVAEVLLDFFDLNISWIAAWIDALMKSFTTGGVVSETTEEDGSTATRQRSLYISLLAEILAKRSSSAESTP